MDVSIVIVSYNVSDLLNACIVSVKRETSYKYEIIIIDNNSADNSVEMIKTKHPDVKLIQNKQNVGFAKANNQGFKESKGRYIFMLNPDTVVLDSAIDKLVQFIDENHEAGACGPKVFNPDMSLQPNCHHFPTILMRLIHHVGLDRKYPESKLFGREFMTYWNYGEIRGVDWITGCALMLRKSALDRVGILDENYFMYTEETDLCYRLNKNGWNIMFYPFASIIHYWGKSSSNQKEQNLFPYLTTKYLLNTKYYFFKKNYGYMYYMCLKLIDFTFYLMVFIRNILRKNAKLRRSKLHHAFSVLSIILFNK